VVVNMPRKSKPRKPVPQPDHVWIAPRPANASQLRTFEPISSVPSNRYLEFADIALGAKKPSSPHKKKSHGPASPVQHEDWEGRVTPIDSRKISNLPRANEGFGAFRNPR
jgi:hypothetical protein